MESAKVFDTWVEVSGEKLHFDVITDEEATALKLANDYVASLGHPAGTVTTRECRFCHEEPLVMFNEEQQREFRETGGFIVPLSA
jgi:hypothetical protein